MATVLAAVLGALIAGGVSIWQTLRAGPAPGSPSATPTTTDSRPPYTPQTGAPSPPPDPVAPGPGPAPGPTVPMLPPSRTPAPAATQPATSPAQPAPVPVQGTSCLPGVWLLQKQIGDLPDSEGGKIRVSLASPGYLMTFGGSGTGSVDMPSAGVWYAGQRDGHTVKVRITGAAGFSWTASGGTVTLRYGASSLARDVYVDDVHQGSASAAYPDSTMTFTCQSGTLDLADSATQSGLSRT
ncbi:hypothetical protein [Longispora albida]|uniref:hypothetical protein n=1 Tax=Longispora albida TaxID=203523 RepID=UPI0012F9B525|nr:hypothetical protein [Longispora albida]